MCLHFLYPSSSEEGVIFFSYFSNKTTDIKRGYERFIGVMDRTHRRTEVSGYEGCVYESESVGESSMLRLFSSFPPLFFD